MSEKDLEINFVKKNYHRNKYAALRRKCIKEYFHNLTDNKIATREKFCNFLRHCLDTKEIVQD